MSSMLMASTWWGLDAAEPLHASGAMRIRTDTAATAASLTEYLRRCGCIVEVVDRRIIDATARPQSFAAPHAQIELEGYLSVWEAMHPESALERLSPTRR